MSTTSPIIADDSGFEALSLSQRKERMDAILNDFGKRMKVHNKRVLEAIIDKVCELETDGNAKIRLNLLATHLGKEGPEILNIVLWDSEHSALKGLDVVRIQDYVNKVDWEDQTGVPGWSRVYNGKYAPRRSVEKNSQAIENFLEELRDGVRNQASRVYLTVDEISKLELPAVFCELYRHTDGLLPANWDRTTFLPIFGSSDPWGAQQAEPLDDLISQARCENQYEVAAGWCPGSRMAYDQSTDICYLLCRSDADEVWRWRVFVQASDQTDNEVFESLADFLVWFSAAYDRTLWKDLFGFLERGYSQVVDYMDIYCEEETDNEDGDDADDLDEIKDEDSGQGHQPV